MTVANEGIMTVAELCRVNDSTLSAIFHNSSEFEEANLTFERFAASMDATCEHLRFDAVVSWVVPVIFAVIVVLGVVGNTLVLVVVLFGQQMRNTTNILILVSLVSCTYCSGHHKAWHVRKRYDHVQALHRLA